MAKQATSPEAAGPGGARFEGQVGAHYLLALLLGAEPRGLAGTRIARVKLQRAAEGAPLDDVIVDANRPSGDAVTLEIQVKATIGFAPSDTVFRDVAAQIVAAQTGEAAHHELAIATARTSHKVDGAYQRVLRWAQQLESVEVFFARLNRPGSANDDMRAFVDTFHTHVVAYGGAADDGAIWSLLRRLRILIFDFAAPDSQSEALARERCQRALHPGDSAKAGALWSTLIAIALETATSGGHHTRDTLRDALTERHGFRLTGEAHNAAAHRALTEASELALADIGDRVGSTSLARQQRLAAVQAARDEGRYVEIRADGGVGKSGILKFLAESLARESRIIVLSPNRTVGRGWPVLRSVLGFQGTAADLLTEIAASGGGTLFLDGLDFFSVEERVTVADLVRTASQTPGFDVIVTARRSFGQDEPNWLPVDALDRLGRATPVVIDGLSDDELEELRATEPRLAPLLAAGHPARDVIRNLFRLGRLANSAPNSEVPHTEADMARQWWSSADGTHDHLHRDRSRLLRAMAEHAVRAGAAPFDTRDQPAVAVDALIRSDTLREIAPERMSFRHDVLRDWAVGNALFEDTTLVGQLRLARPALAALERGVELAARLFIERAADATDWKRFLDLLSGPGAHGSWRRAALMALVRSEKGLEALERSSPYLLENRGSLLRELIRTTMSVDAATARELFAESGADISQLPIGLHLPTGPSWARLSQWALTLGGRMPAQAVGDFCDLFGGFSLGTFGRDPLTPYLVTQQYAWLMEIENADAAEFAQRCVPFGGTIGHDALRKLETDLRTTFLLFCRHTPELAQEYVEFLRTHERGGHVARGLLKFSGSLAESAPAAFADLVAATLLPDPQVEERPYGRREWLDAFDYADRELLPPSPTQGPFLELLNHSPRDGIALIRRLVDHAIAFCTEGRDVAPDIIALDLPGGQRNFSWRFSYGWSRQGPGHYCVTSGLMALEAWGHRRIDGGEAVDTVVADILGPGDAPAAYLLVAVDLILSHWPKSRDIAAAFVASPELLALDRRRQAHDVHDIGGLVGVGSSSNRNSTDTALAALKNRASRRNSLDQTIWLFAIDGPEAVRSAIAEKLSAAAKCLGPYGASADMTDPAFMAAHALNLIDPANYRTETVRDRAGNEFTAYAYVAPAVEAEHLAPMQAVANARMADTNLRMELANALEDPARGSIELAAKGVALAQHLPDAEDEEDRDWDHTPLIAAALLMRDGDPDLRAGYAAWADAAFAAACTTREDGVHRIRPGLRFNPLAIAAVGMIHRHAHAPSPENLRSVLELAARNDPAAAHGFGAAAQTVRGIDPRLPSAILRCAFAAAIRPWPRHFREEGADDEHGAERRAALDAAVNAELRWLLGGATESAWPAFPEPQVRTRTRIRIPDVDERPRRQQPKEPRPELMVDHQAAALWLRKLVDGSAGSGALLRAIVDTYGSWTATANGAGLNEEDEISRAPSEWNAAFFDILARTLPDMPEADIDRIALDPICGLPEDSFFDTSAIFLPAVDAVYFDRGGLHEEQAVRIRTRLADRLTASGRWRWHLSRPSYGVETHLGPALATLLFNGHFMGQPPHCYLYPRAMERLTPFKPLLTSITTAGASLFIAMATLNLLEIAPRAEDLEFGLSAAAAWLRHWPHDSAFWLDYSVGRRVCEWVDAVRRSDPQALTDPRIRGPLEGLLAELVRLGIPEAHQVEVALTDLA